MGVTPSFPQDNVQLPSWDITSGSKVQDSALENDLLALLNEGSTMISGIDNGAASSSAHSGQIKRKPAKKVIFLLQFLFSLNKSSRALPKTPPPNYFFLQCQFT